MLSIQPIKSASSAKHYYADKDNYYLSDKESLDKMSQWLGEGAEKLGLRGEVNPEQFLAMLEGRLPNGQTLGVMKDGELQHRSGTDITLSAPKSVSILALVGCDQRLLEAQKRAVLKTAEIIEQVAAEARLTVNGETVFEKTGNLTIADFPHTSTRELDPGLHDHLVILNATERSDGEWRALSSRAKNDTKNLDHGFREIIYNNQHYFGLVYTATLAKEVKTLGYDIRIVDQYGNFEIEGVPPELIKDMSKRRQDIVKSMEETGFKGAKAAEIATLNTRKQKASIDSQTLQTYWQEEVREKGINLEEVIERSKDQIEHGEPGEVKSSIPPQISQTIKEALDDAILHLSQFNAQLKHGAMVRLAFSFAGGQIEHEDIEAEIKNRIDTQELTGKQHDYYTSKALQEKEDSFVRTMRSGDHRAFSLNTEHRGLPDKLLESRNRVQIIDVKGLTQEKHLLNNIVRNTEEAGLTAYVLHPTRFAANRLSDNVARDNSTLWQWFKNAFKDDLVQTVAGFKYHYETRLNSPFAKKERHDVILVHDAQKLSFNDLEDLNQLAKKSDSKLVLLNNTQSTDGFFAGSPIKALKEAGIETHQSTTITKNADVQLNIHQNPMDALVKNFTGLSDEARAKTALVAGSNKDKALLTEKIREVLLAEGKLSAEVKKVDVLSTESLSDAQKKHGKFYSAGDRMIVSPFTKNQTQYTVTESKKDCVFAEDAHGKAITFDLKKDTGFRVNKQTTLELRAGDELMLNEGIFTPQLKMKKGSVLKITELSDEGIKARSGKQTLSFSNQMLSGMLVSFSTVKKISELQGNVDAVLIPMEANHINQERIAELSEYTGKVQLFTDDANKAQKNLEKAEIRFTVADIAQRKPELIYRDMAFAEASIIKDLNFLIEDLSRNIKELNKEEIATRAISYAVAKSAERDAAFKHTDLMVTALKYAIGHVDAGDIEKVLDERKTQGNLIHLDTFWITKEALAMEQEILAENKRGQGILEPIEKNTQVLRNLPEHLTQGQKEAITLSVTSQDRFVTVQGLAGVGKTTMLQQVKAIAEKNQMEVLGLAPTHRAVSELTRNGIASQTIDSFLLQDKSITNKTLLIVDEASMIGNSNYLNLQKKVIEHNARLVFTGDITQLQSLSSGIPHELTVSSKTQKTAFMNEIVRQNPNPDLKKAATHASKREIKEAFATLETIAPADYVERRTERQESTTSVIEIAPRKTEDGKNNYAPHYEAIAKDFLTRTDEHQNKTIVVVHAHEDRRAIDSLLREGLKAQNKISQHEIIVSRLFPKDLKKADLLHAENFSEGNVLRFDKSYSVARKGDYFTVTSVDIEKNLLKCTSEDGHNFSIHPDIMAKNARMSIFVKDEFPLAEGDKIRLKRTDLKKDHVANAEYQVVEIDDKKMATLKSEKGEALVLNLNDKSEQHWDYAYTDTAYGIQGGTSKLVIALELSGRIKTTTHRSHEIDITRASHQVSIYTDDKNALVERLNDPKHQRDADKTSAFTELKRFKEEKTQTEKVINKRLSQQARENNSKEAEDANLTIKPTETYKPRLDAKVLLPLLNERMESLSLTLLGEPNHHLSKKDSLRYGKKGSLNVDLNKGLWKNFETGEGGNAFHLIQSTLGLQSFPECLDYAAEFLGESSVSLSSPKRSVAKLQKDNAPKHEGKRQYAEKLYQRSLPIANTLAETYLKKHRGLAEYNGAELRYLKTMPTVHGEKKTTVPALLAVARDENNNVHHVQVIRLNKTTANKDLKSLHDKQTYGAIDSKPLDLNKKATGDVTYLCEGVETGLSILAADKNARVYALLGKENFAKVELKNLTKKVVLCVDDDGDATYRLNTKDENPITQAIKHLQKNGYEVKLVIPKETKQDLNDVLKKEGVVGLSKTLNAVIKPDEYLKRCKELMQKEAVAESLVKQLKPQITVNLNHDQNTVVKQYEQQNKTFQDLVKDLSQNPVREIAPKTLVVQTDREMER